MTTSTTRDQIIDVARSLFERRLTHGRTGNISVREGDRLLVTPTGSSLGTVTADELSVIDLEGRHLDGPKPSKEAFLHAAVLRARPRAGAAVHTHSTHAAAVSCLADIDDEDVLPPLTAYFAMRVGTLVRLPYFAPGDASLEAVAERSAMSHRALLLRNHGPIVTGSDLLGALDCLEELEETARLFLLLHGQRTAPLTAQQAEALRS